MTRPRPPALAVLPALAALPLLAALLAGCTEAPTVPPEATTVRDAALPGLLLHAWTETTEDGVLLHAVLENDGDGFYDHRSECGHPWHSRLEGPAGEAVHAKAVEPCQEYFYDRLAPGHALEFRQTWDLRDHGAPDATDGTQGDGAPPRRVPAGTYAWDLVVDVIGPRNGTLSVRLPIEVPDGPGQPGETDHPPTADPTPPPS